MKKIMALFTLTLLAIGGLYFFNNTNANEISFSRESSTAEEVDASADKESKLNSTSEVEPKRNSTKVETINTEAYFEKYYNSVEELTKSADIIIEGKVIETESFDYNTTTYTKSKVKVSKSYNNNANSGDILTIVEIGGMTTKGAVDEYNKGKLKVKKEKKNEPIRITLNGMPVMENGQKVLLFGVKASQNNMLEEQFFHPIGSYQGKFIIDGQKVKRAKSSNNDDNTLKSLETNLEEIDLKIKKLTK